MQDEITPVVGQWYMVSYGYELPTGRCIAVRDGFCWMSFRWGNPYRTTHLLRLENIITPMPDPRWLPSLWRWLRGKPRVSRQAACLAAVALLCVGCDMDEGSAFDRMKAAQERLRLTTWTNAVLTTELIMMKHPDWPSDKIEAAAWEALPDKGGTNK